MDGGTELWQVNNMLKVIHPESNRGSISIQSSNPESSVLIAATKMSSMFTLHRVNGGDKVGGQPA